MKKRFFFKRLLYKLNLVFALFLLVSLILPYVSPNSFPYISLLSLTVSPLILINGLFSFYWIITLQKKFLLSTTILFLAYFSLDSFYKFSSEAKEDFYDVSLSIMSYNVRLFNLQERDDVKSQKFISKLIAEENPDIICIQEYFRYTKIEIEGYPYSYIHSKNEKGYFASAIVSKYPLINKGAFDFSDTANNTLFVDVLKDNDTLRLYNVHLESMKVLPTVDFLNKENKNKLLKRVSTAFQKQQDQVGAIIKHKEKSPHPVIVAGDFNNTASSYVYRKMKENMKDAYIEAGNGLGTTFKFDSYPIRIDFIFASEMIDIIDFKTIDHTFSDHYPLKTTVGWNVHKQ